MTGFNAAFKAEVMRLARKEIRDQVSSTKKASSQHRREIAQLKREITALQRQVRFLEKRESARLGPAAKSVTRAAEEEAPRFSPKWLQAHRKKIGFSAREYALLVGVSPLTIYNWEHGKSKPQAAKLDQLAAVRGIGKRDAQRRLALIEG